MNKLLINIAKRLTCKAIEINKQDFKMEVSYKFIVDTSTIYVCIFKNAFVYESFYLYDDTRYNESHISQYRQILRAVNKGVRE